MKKTSLLLIGVSLSALAAQAADKVVPADNTAVNELDRSKDKVVPADNTAVNERDRSNQTLTPLDQSESKSDIALVARVRRAVVAKRGLSIAAQNIKIIAQNDRVTLRGPVKDNAERATIENTVRLAAGKATVDNQLEVK